jgi:hypothetical protein
MSAPNRLGRLLHYMTSAWAYARQPFQPSEKVRGVLQGLTQTTHSSGQGDLDYFATLAITNAAMLAGTSLIADRVKDCIDDFKIQEKGSDGKWVDVEGHEFLDLLRKPNDFMEGSIFLGELVYEQFLFGNGYWLINSKVPGRGPIHEILYLPGQSVRPRPDSLRRSPITGGLVIDYEYSLGGYALLPGESIAHFRNENPFDYWQGLSLLTALQHTLEITHSQANWLADHYSQGNAIPSAIISVPPEIEDIEIEQIRDDIRNQFGGRHRTAITRAGEMAVEVIQHTIADMQLLDAQAYLEKQVRRVLKVPEAFDSASSGQARLAAETALMRDAVQPFVKHIAEVITLKILPFYGQHRNLRCVVEDIVPQDRALAVTEYQVFGGDRTLNENRKEQDLPALQLAGPLAHLQPLYDQVPFRYLQLMMPLLQQSLAAPAGPGAAAAQDHTPQGIVERMTGQALIEDMTGRGLIEQMSGQGDRRLIGLMTGKEKVDAMAGQQGGGMVEAGQQVATLPNQEQLLQQLTGGDGIGEPLSDSEKMALLYLIHASAI